MKKITFNEEKTDMDALNEYLIEVSNMNEVGIRKKIVEIRKFLDVLSNKNPEPKLIGRKILFEIDNPPDQIKKLMDYLIEEVSSAGGDGDCTVICTCYDAGNLASILWKELENRGVQQWYKYSKNDNGVNINAMQECFTFVNTEDENIPIWSQCIIKI